MKRLSLNQPNIVDRLNQIHSIYPCTGYLTFGVWLYLVPQYKPKTVLMLGYGGGTAAGLIRLFYGDDVAITAVDMDDCSDFNYYNVNLIEADALEYVRQCQDHYDTIIVDLYQEGKYHAEPFVFETEFVEHLKRLGDYLIIHTVKGDDMSAYDGLYKVRELTTNSAGKYEPHFHYFMVNEVNALPVR